MIVTTSGLMPSRMSTAATGVSSLVKKARAYRFSMVGPA